MKYVLTCLLLLFSTYAQAASPDGFQARVVGVHDGDTLTILDGSRQQYKIRLAEIDAPETRQDYGSRSKQMLSDLIFGKEVTVYPGKKDRYGRLIAHIEFNSRDIGRTMIENGGAWAYPKYLENENLLLSEETARLAKLGLWGVSSSPIPPWEWRKSR